MNGNDGSTARGVGPDIAPDLSKDGRPEKFARAAVRRGRPPRARPKVSTAIRLSREVIGHFRAGGAAGRRGWTTLSATGSGGTRLLERTLENSRQAATGSKP